MNKKEAQAERTRLHNLLEAYEGDRDSRRAEGERLNREVTPDRGDKVRARIAGLDEIIAGFDGV